MKTSEQEVADALAKLRAIADHYKAGAEAWRREKRAIIDICIAHADIATLEAILDHLERSSPWTRWPSR